MAIDERDLLQRAMTLVNEATAAVVANNKLPPNKRYAVDALYYTARVEAIIEMVLPYITFINQPPYQTQLATAQWVNTMLREKLKEWADQINEPPTPHSSDDDAI